MNKRKYLTFFLLSLLIHSCCTENERKVKTALELAGNHSLVLKRVMDHFSDDSLKQEAAKFLIGNMPGCYGYLEKDLAELKPLYNAYDLINRKFGYNTNKKWGYEIDSLQQRYSPFLSCIQQSSDLTNIEASYLIHEIDRSWTAWRHNKHTSRLPFADFLEYILPYRRLNGLVMDSSRDTFYQRHFGKFYISSSKSWKEETDSLLQIYSHLVHSQFFGTSIPLFNASGFEHIRHGLCIHRCWFNSLLLSALGMPVAIDFVPAWGNRNNSHTWNVIVMNGKSHAFESFWDNDRWKYKHIYNNRNNDHLWGKFRLPKVYRYTYSNHPEGPVLDIDIPRADIPALFHNIKKKDVSKEYFKTEDVCIKLTRLDYKWAKYAYLAVFNYQQWVPVQWGKVESDGTTVFHGMGKDMVYLPVYYRNGETVPASDPFRLENDGSIRFLTADEDYGDIHLRMLTGAPAHDDNRNYLHSFKGIRFEAITDGKTSHFLCELNDSLEIQLNRYHVSYQDSCRYIRMYLPKDTLAASEITFFSPMGQIYSVWVLSEGVPIDSISEKAGFLTDGTEATTCRRKFPKGYIDFDLRAKYILKNIGFYPYIKSQILRDDNYELRYWKNGWKHHTNIKGTEHGWLKFENVPLHSLMMLKNTRWKGRSAERIFTLNNDGTINWE